MITADVVYLCVFEVDGEKHVIKATGSRNVETVRGHLQAMNSKMKILELRPASFEEIEKAAADVRSDPDYSPLTNAGLAATPDSAV